MLSCIKACYHNRYRPVALESSPLANLLPLDIIYGILSHVPVSTAAVFSISCMQLHRLTGDNYIKQLSNDSLILCLKLLSKDLPGHILCSTCKKLHQLRDAQYFTCIVGRRPEEIPACIYQSLRNSHKELSLQRVIGSNFSTTLVKMAFKQHEKGPNCRKILDLMCYDSTPIDNTGNYLWQVKDTVYLQQGKMTIHSQSVHITARSRTSFVFREPTYLPKQICRHHTLKNEDEGAWCKGF